MEPRPQSRSPQKRSSPSPLIASASPNGGLRPQTKSPVRVSLLPPLSAMDSEDVSMDADSRDFQPFHSPGRRGGGSSEQNAYPSQATANNAALLSVDADGAASERISDRDRDSQNQALLTVGYIDSAEVESVLAKAADQVTNSEINTTFQLYRVRWIVLLLFSLQAFMSNVICYSYAAVPLISSEYFGTDEDAMAWLVTVFFITYIPLTIPSSWALVRYDFKKCLLFAAILQTVGAGVRCITFSGSSDKGSYEMVLLGQILASCAQCFFVNSPPFVSALWFGDRERTLATTLSVNANTLGIAGAYILGSIVTSDSPAPGDVEKLNLLIVGVLVAITIFTVFLPARPSSPPSRSAALKVNAERTRGENAAGTETEGLCAKCFHEGIEGMDWKSFKAMFMTTGFTHTLVVFAMAETAINMYSTFLTYMLQPLNFSVGYISGMGAGFIVACLLGSALIGVLVDRTKRYKLFVVVTMALTTLLMAIFSFLDTASMAPNAIGLAFVIIAIGFFIGPAQPVALELCAEITYPVSEAAMTAIQQLAGNIFSTAMVPILLALRSDTDKSFERANWFLTATIAAATGYFLFFRGTLSRSNREIVVGAKEGSFREMVALHNQRHVERTMREVSLQSRASSASKAVSSAAANHHTMDDIR